ncbi:hypothetical protein [Sulfuricurvum sp.]|uniref:hypothetical protein n=1 Tax=Sulfuricurvum sp. TaxID=2025608 RepID=UPI0026384FC2|nr:hypothetical protein [Sulfuricurvum sp.]MDD3597369.1 hypothetical protein [Sulfuricurvum sp.]
MTRKKVLILILSLLSTEILAEGIPKDLFLSAAETGFPVKFCNPQTPFRQCFNITPQECEETISSATRVCIKKSNNQIPNFITSREEAGQIGKDIGSCAGQAFALTHRKKFIISDQCNKMLHLQ